MTLARRFRGEIAAIGIGSPLTYYIILLALQQGPLGYVVAVRECAIVIGALYGVLLLGEPAGQALPLQRGGIQLNSHFAASAPAAPK